MEAAAPAEFVCALAAQCYNTEYAWMPTGPERLQLSPLRSAIEVWLAAEADLTIDAAEHELMLSHFALYEPLSALSGWERLAHVELSVWSEWFAPLVREQVHEQLLERRLSTALPLLTPIADAVSQRVRAMYEENPYPRWVTLQQPVRTTVSEFIRRLRPELSEPVANRSVLVAGGGSGQQPVQMAMSFADAHVLSFDLSRASLAYASRMASRFGVTNVQFMQGDLLELPPTAGPFAIVSCSGVLHHLRDPMAGWTRLRNVLTPDGVMKIGLYSTAARTAVEAARAFASKSAFTANACTADEDGLRAARQSIAALPVDDAARGVTAFIDFYSMSGFRDLVLHVQERTYTMSQIAAALEALELRFLGFQLPQPVQARFIAEQGADALLDLDAWGRFESAHPDTFVAMYQFWCCRR